MNLSIRKQSILDRIKSSVTGLMLAVALVLNMSAVTSTGFFCSMSGVAALSPCGCAHNDDHAEDESTSFERVSCCSQVDSTTYTPEPRVDSKSPDFSWLTPTSVALSPYNGPTLNTITEAWSPRGPPLPPDKIPMRVRNQSFQI
jgi:hypothetical protein